MRKTILSLAMFVISSTQALEASPVISAVNVPSSARIMTEVELAVSAESDDAERGLSCK